MSEECRDTLWQECWSVLRCCARSDGLGVPPDVTGNRPAGRAACSHATGDRSAGRAGQLDAVEDYIKSVVGAAASQASAGCHSAWPRAAASQRVPENISTDWCRGMHFILHCALLWYWITLYFFMCISNTGHQIFVCLFLPWHFLNRPILPELAPVLAVIMCLSVHLFICLSQVGVQLKRLNVESCKQRHRTWTPVFWCQKSWQNSNGVIPNGAVKCRWG